MNKSKTGLKNDPLNQNKERNGKIKKNIIRKVYNKEDRSLCLCNSTLRQLAINLIGLTFAKTKP